MVFFLTDSNSVTFVAMLPIIIITLTVTIATTITVTIITIAIAIALLLLRLLLPMLPAKVYARCRSTQREADFCF